MLNLLALYPQSRHWFEVLKSRSSSTHSDEGVTFYNRKRREEGGGGRREGRGGEGRGERRMNIRPQMSTVKINVNFQSI